MAVLILRSRISAARSAALAARSSRAFRSAASVGDPGLHRQGQADGPCDLGVAAAQRLQIDRLAGGGVLGLTPDRSDQVQTGVDHLLRRAQLRLRQLLGGLWRDRFGGVGGWLGRGHNGNIEWTDPD